ncbi:response regulator transcription factor [Lentibacillus cibarius]|uniref:Response regulator transcription factor n=2 Tax=Lentibacillus cibarius TaxID=2583219 RepID=A0A549YF73_9BACI|nr:response regulator transcription factor [Lentibacillus cibarius]
MKFGAIEQEEEMKLVCELPYIQTVGKLVPLFKPDVVLFDMDGLQVGDAVSAVNKIKTELPHAKLIVLVSYGRKESELLRMIEADIDSLLEKTVQIRNQVINAIEAAMNNQYIMPHHLIRPFEKRLMTLKTISFDIFSIQLKERGFHLTRRETEVAYWLRRGLGNKKIAEKLMITKGTVRVYVSHVYEKMYCDSRQELIDNLQTIPRQPS